MNHKEIITMAREAGFVVHEPAPATIWAGRECSAELVRFAALAAAREREGCAQLAMEFRRGAGDPVCGELAALIRARSNT